MQEQHNKFIALKQKRFIAAMLVIFTFFLSLPTPSMASETLDDKNLGTKEAVHKKAKTKAKEKTKEKAKGADNFKNKKGNVPGYLVKDINDAAKVAGLDSSLLASQLDKESHFNPKAVSSVGAQGIAQFMPATWKTYGNGGDPFNPHDAIAAQGRYLKALSDRVAKISKDTKIGKDKLVLAAYNAGEGAIEQYHGIPPYRETQGYVKKILADTATFI